MTMTIETLIAKQEIADVIYRYARGIDRLDLDLVRTCYHPDAYDDHGTFQGGVEDFLAFVAEFLPGYAVTQHFMGNLLVEVDGDRARAETYAVAYHRKALPDGCGKDDVFGIRYVDRFEKRSGEWRIAHRVVATEWWRVDPVPPGKVRGGVGVWGTRDGNDAIDWIMGARPPVTSASG